MGSFGSFGVMGLAVAIAGAILFFVMNRGKKKSQPPAPRNGEVPGRKVGDKVVRLPLRPVTGSKDNDNNIGIREIIRQELNRMNGKEPEPEPPAAEPPEQTIEIYEKADKFLAANAEIVDPQHRTIGLYHVELLPKKDYGRTYLIGSQNVFSLRKLPDGSLERMHHSTSMDHPPSEIYRAIHTKDKVTEVFGDHDEGDNKLKIGLLVLAACVALFIMFMAIYKGGK